MINVKAHFIQHLTAWLAMKALKVITLLFALSLITFLLVKNSPIDPIQAYIGADMMRVSPEQRESIAAYWGLDLSTPEQFMRWGSALLSGDLGTSMIYRQPVAEVLSEKFINSIALMSLAWILSGVMGFSLGVIAAMNQSRWIDRFIKWYCYTLAATPTFWIGLLLVMVFAVWLNWFPIGMSVPAGVTSAEVTFMDRMRHLILPVLTLSIVGVANIALHTRQKLVDVLSSDYVLFARARGEQGFTLFWRHGLRNVALPAATLQFASFSELFGGAVLAEQVFSYPGLGQATVEAGLRGDVPLLLGLVMFSAVFVIAGNVIADLLYRCIDPRIREGTWK